MTADGIEAQAASFWELLEAVPDAMVVTARDGRIRYVNEQTLSLFGYARDELIGELVEVLLPGRLCEAHARQRSGYFSQPKRRPMGMGLELIGRRKDGTEVPVEISLAPTRSAEGVLVTAAVRDVTERKRVEALVAASEARSRAGEELRAYNAELERQVHARTAELEEANQFLNTIIENIPNMVFVKDAERLAFVRFNRAGEELLGVAREDLMGKNDYDLFPKAEADFFQAKDRETLRSTSALEIPEEPIETKRGTRWLHTRKVPITSADGTPQFLLGISEDITDRKLSDETRARLAAIVDSSDDAIIGRDLGGVVTSWNKGAERVFGYSAEEMIGKQLFSLFPAGRENDEVHLLKRLQKGERIDHFESVQRRKDGQEIDVSVNISVILDSTGALIGTSKIARDITAVKRAQDALARAKDATEAANRELESFSYSVAHDLRAPLRAIDGFSQALLEDCADQLDATGKSHLERVRNAAQRMGQLIDDLLMLSRVGRSELRRESIDLSRIAENVGRRLRDTQPEREVALEVEDGMVVTADARLLGIVVENLLGNAWKFTSKRPAARIEVGSTSKDGDPVYFVRDNGAGFDMAYADKLFGAFQRLHAGDEFPGTGIGLATVQRVIHRHGGRVWAESQSDRGTTIYFTLG